MVIETAVRAGGRADEQGLLFETSAKVLLWAAFFELVLYRLVSRLGMHLSKLAAKYESVRITFKVLSSMGFTLLNLVSMLVFLVLSLALLNKVRSIGSGRYDALVVPATSLLLALTIGFLIFPPAMLGSVVYNGIFWTILIVLVTDYLSTPRPWSQRIMIVVYFLGISGWLYYQVVSTTYGLIGSLEEPPLVHEINRAGEALMVLASMLVFWAYGGFSLTSTNKRQRRRTIAFALTAVASFLLLLFVDSLAGWYDPAVAEDVRKAGEGIGWIFQMGMGYTFYLPFALYMAGLLAWSYTVVRLYTQGRYEGIGIGLMFLAGYALQLSHLTLMVLLGVLLLTLERKRAAPRAGMNTEESVLAGEHRPLLGQQA
jgi:hypothetical protein